MPAWTAVVQYLLYGEKLSFRVYLTLIPIIGGAMMVCKGEISGTMTGVVILLVSCFVSTIKGIITKRLLSTGNKLSPLHLLTIVFFQLGSLITCRIAVLERLSWLPSHSSRSHLSIPPI